MEEFIVPFILGVVCVFLGFSNMRGNINSLHFYHRSHVSEENRIPFGRKVGLGTIICGCAVLIYSVLSAITVYTGMQVFVLIGSVIMIIGLVTGLGLSLYAMIRYNKGIFIF